MRTLGNISAFSALGGKGMYSMSSNKTPCFQLHSWEPGDNFLLQEINENFALLDGVVVTGSYVGDEKAERAIELGFRPTVVLLCDQSGRMGYFANYNATSGGLFFPGCPINGTSNGLAAEITGSGFRVCHGGWNQVNAKSTRYHYLALR